MSDTCSLFPRFGDPWPSCLLPSQYPSWVTLWWLGPPTMLLMALCLTCLVALCLTCLLSLRRSLAERVAVQDKGHQSTLSWIN